MFFNRTKGCFVGYSPLPSEDWYEQEVYLYLPTEYKDTGYSISELYYAPNSYDMSEISVDPALYGFK